MSGERPDNALRPGAIRRVTVAGRRERPVVIECHDHTHRYEVAWRETESGPAITDLRVFSTDGSPITKSTLARINPERLAVAAASYRGEVQFNELQSRRMREHMREVLAERGVDADELSFEVTSWTEPAEPRRIKKKRPPGRPRISAEELVRVAQWAREAAAEAVQDRQPVYPKIADRARRSGWRSDEDWLTDNTIRGWVKRCKDAGLLEADYARQPRRKD